MNQTENLSSKENISGNTLDIHTEQTQGGDTVDTCTMDPCPMKTEGGTDHPEKCPKCGMTEK